MSSALPVVTPESDFLASLIDEQQDLSAVESFSQWHDEGHESRPAQEAYYRSLLPASAPGPGQQFAFEVDLNACSGCKACVVACHTLNGLEEDESWRRVGTLVIGNEEEEQPAAIQHVTTACHHCADPGCLNGCPVKAYDKDPVTGIVRHLDDQCIGCKYCTMMCPYEVPQYSDRLGIVRKCDMCHQRLSVGEAPACVQSCPNEAIKIRIVDAEPDLGPESTLVPSAPASSITTPTSVYRSDDSVNLSLAAPQDKNVDEVAESHWPLAMMLVATQVCVGILVMELASSMVLRLAGTPAPYSAVLASVLVAFAIGNVGLAIAPLHLGQPLRMWRVFLGLGTSWLSREAVVLGKFMGILALGIGLLALPAIWEWIPESVQAWIPKDSIPSWAPRLLLVASIPAGVIGLYCSAMIYIATRRQLWRAERTLPRFFGTSLVVAPLIVASIDGFCGSATVAVVLSLLAVVANTWKYFFERAVYLSRSESEDEYDRRSRDLIHDHLHDQAELRVLLSIGGIALSVLASIAFCASPWVGGIIALIAATTVLAGECLERLLYFQSVVYDRMPGTL